MQEWRTMNLADQMLLAQLRESALRSVPDDQWNLVLGEVEKAGGVRNLEGYAQTLVFDAIRKASFGGNRSDAGRYAANVRWQGQGAKGTSKYPTKIGGREKRKAWKGATEERLGALFQRRYFDPEGPGSSEAEDQLFRNRGWLKENGEVNFDIVSREGVIGKYQIPKGATFEKDEGNIADELVNPNMPPDYNDYGDEPARDEPFTPATAVDEARRVLRGEMVPMDLKNPQASASKKTPENPAKVTASLKEAKLSQISQTIRRDLQSQGKEVNYAAAPYLDALDTMGDIGDNYYQDSGTSVVAYLLNNLSGYKGETARAVKAELNARLKAQRKK